MHEAFFSDFEFPQFLRMLNAYVIEDDDGIILAGGVELVGEAVLVTNKERNPHTIGRALLEAKQIAEFTCKKVGIRDLYAFVNNSNYAKHLIQHGFQSHELTTLSMRIK